MVRYLSEDTERQEGKSRRKLWNNMMALNDLLFIEKIWPGSYLCRACEAIDISEDLSGVRQFITALKDKGIDMAVMGNRETRVPFDSYAIQTLLETMKKHGVPCSKKFNRLFNIPEQQKSPAIKPKGYNPS